MRALVKGAALSTLIVIANVQPGADAARGPDFAPGLRQEAVISTGAADIGQGLRQNLEKDIGPDLGLAPLRRPADILSSAAATEFPKSAFLNDVTGAVSLPPLGDISLALYGVRPQVEPAAPAVAMIPNDKPAAPEIDIPLPAVRPLMKAPRLAAPIEQIKFQGPTMAPFAHVRFCMNNPAECRERKTVFRGGPVKLTEAKRHELLRVNTEVNRAIIAQNQTDETAATEKWLISPEFGDCNDYAVTKRHKLLAKGWPERALLLAEVIVPSGEHHVVVVVRTDKGDLVLDNLSATLRSPSKTRYQWVRVESPVNPKFWSKVAQPTTEMAAADRRQPRRL